jgi:hypothetical protein
MHGLDALRGAHGADDTHAIAWAIAHAPPALKQKLPVSLRRWAAEEWVFREAMCAGRLRGGLRKCCSDKAGPGDRIS